MGKPGNEARVTSIIQFALEVPLISSSSSCPRAYFRAAKQDANVMWSLIEQSLDNTVYRILEPGEDPSTVVDLWGKSRVSGWG